jgi:hypothetical protein
MKKAKNKDNVYLQVVVNKEVHKKEIEDFKIDNCEVFYFDTNIKGVCLSTYYLTNSLKANDKDIIIVCSDDFFAPEYWDEYLINQFKDFNGGIIVNDGYQDPYVINYRTSITIPIMTYYCLKQLNMATYHPSYIHFWGDTELYFNIRDLGLLKDDRINDNTLFEHRHYYTGKHREKDEHDESNLSTLKLDENNYNTRMKLNVSERIKMDKGYLL